MIYIHKIKDETPEILLQIIKGIKDKMMIDIDGIDVIDEINTMDNNTNPYLVLSYYDKYFNKKTKSKIALERIDIIRTNECMNVYNTDTIIKLGFVAYMNSKNNDNIPPTIIIYDTVCDKIVIATWNNKDEQNRQDKQNEQNRQNNRYHIIYNSDDSDTAWIWVNKKDNNNGSIKYKNIVKGILKKLKRYIASKLYTEYSDYNNKDKGDIKKYIDTLVDEYMNYLFVNTKLFKNMDERTRMIVISDDFIDILKEYVKLVILNQ